MNPRKRAQGMGGGVRGGVKALGGQGLLLLCLGIAAIDAALGGQDRPLETAPEGARGQIGSRALLQAPGNQTGANASATVAGANGTNGTNGTHADPDSSFVFSHGVGAEAMGVWHGYEDERRCGGAVSARLGLRMVEDGTILADWDLEQPSPTSEGDPWVVVERFSANLSVTFVRYRDMSVSVNAIAMDLTGVERWFRGCDGGDMTDAWQERVTDCTRNSTGPRPGYCSVEGTLNVSISPDGEAYELHICIAAWSLQWQPAQAQECYLLVQHTAPVPGTYGFASCSCEPAACPSGTLTIRDVNPIFCTAGVDWEAHEVIGVPRLDCPQNKDMLSVQTAEAGMTMHVSYGSKLWKAGRCYGALDCLAGECMTPAPGPETCVGGPTVFVVAPASVAAVGQTALTVVGNCFQGGGGGVSVSYGPYTCASPTLLSDWMLTCTSVPGVGAGLVVTVTADGVQSYGTCDVGEGCSVTYTPPAVTHASPSTCPSFGGCVMTVRGSDFGVPAQEGVVVQVFVGGEECLIATERCPQCGHIGDAEIICLVTSSTAFPPSPVTVRRHSPASRTASCSDCESGYEALYIHPPGDEPDGCVCAALGSGASFAYLSASPIISLTILGDVAGFDVEGFRRKLAGVLGILAEQVYVTGVRPGSVIVDFALLSTIGNSIGHIQALSDLRDRSNDGSLAAVFPSAVNVTVAGEEEEMFEVVAAAPAETPAPEPGIVIMWWQVVIIVMVLGAAVACLGAVWRYSSLPNLGPWGTTAARQSKLPSNAGEEEGDDDPDAMEGSTKQTLSFKRSTSSTRSLGGQSSKILRGDSAKNLQKLGCSKNLRPEKSGLGAELFL